MMMKIELTFREIRLNDPGGRVHGGGNHHVEELVAHCLNVILMLWGVWFPVLHMLLFDIPYSKGWLAFGRGLDA